MVFLLTAGEYLCVRSRCHAFSNRCLSRAWFWECEDTCTTCSQTISNNRRNFVPRMLVKYCDSCLLTVVYVYTVNPAEELTNMPGGDCDEMFR
jgi:hypothetical protein